MNNHIETTQPAIVVTAPEGLAAIHQPGCAAAIWDRQPHPDFQTWINTLPRDQLPRARIILRPGAVRDAVSEIVELCAMRASAQRDRFVDDVAALAHIFAGVMTADWLRLRLDVVDNNACRRFHVDTLTARLVCTYRGTGTQYGISTDGAEPPHILTVPTTAPVVLRGKLWPEQPRSGLLHRSPPIEGTGETRSVLVLDPIYDPEKEADHHIVH